MNLKILKFDRYSKAYEWLNNNDGIAVRGEDTLLSMPNSRPSLHILFSNLMAEGDRLKILEFFPEAQNLNDIRNEMGDPRPEHEHLMYLIFGKTRNQIVEILKSNFGAIAIKSPCCLETVDNKEIFSRLEELQMRLGTPLSQAEPSKMGNLYRKLYP